MEEGRGEKHTKQKEERTASAKQKYPTEIRSHRSEDVAEELELVGVIICAHFINELSKASPGP